MPDDDRDDYRMGPGPQQSRGAVVEAYVDTDALEHHCPHCHAKPGDFCLHESGHERKVPCPKRIAVAARAHAAQEGGEQ